MIGAAGLLGVAAACGDSTPPGLQGYAEGEYVLIAAPSAGTLHSLSVARGQQGHAGDALFTPGWTDYEKRVSYQTYDVTSAVREGGNALTVLLADGWHSGDVGYGRKRAPYTHTNPPAVTPEQTCAATSKRTRAK